MCFVCKCKSLDTKNLNKNLWRREDIKDVIFNGGLKCLFCRGDQSYKNDSSPTCLNTEWSQDVPLTTLDNQKIIEKINN